MYDKYDSVYIDTSRRTSAAVSHCVCVRSYISKHFQVLMHEKMVRIVLFARQANLLATKKLKGLNIKEQEQEELVLTHKIHNSL